MCDPNIALRSRLIRNIKVPSYITLHSSISQHHSRSKMKKRGGIFEAPARFLATRMGTPFGIGSPVGNLRDFNLDRETNTAVYKGSESNACTQRFALTSFLCYFFLLPSYWDNPLLNETHTQ